MANNRKQPRQELSHQPTQDQGFNYHVLKSFNSAFERLHPDERRLIRLKFCDPLLHKFFTLQCEEAAKQVTELDPALFPQERAQDFLQAAKETRLVWQFWTDFGNMVRDWAKSDGYDS